MSVSGLLDWQWRGYRTYHGSRANLLIHIVAVPLFLAGNVGLVAALIWKSWVLASISLLAMIVSLALQGRGHRQEEVPPEPFSSPANAVARLLLEQWMTFPRFVLSGGWLRAWRREAAS